MLKRLLDKIAPISERDRELVRNINKKKTIRTVRGAVYVGAEDVEEAMKALHKRTRHLVRKIRST